MGEKNLYQPLTREDKITVVLYRVGIVLSALIIAGIAWMSLDPSYFPAGAASARLKFNALLILLYVSVGMSVFFIHLYVGSFHRALKKLYYIALAALLALFFIGKGDVLGVLGEKAYGPLFLMPLSGCLGFIAAKEAFCFKLLEGYLLAMIMPLYLLYLSLGGMAMKGASYGIVLIAALLVLFTLRKVFMPIHYDIGDKSAYT